MIRVPLGLMAASLPGARMVGRPDVLVQGITADSHAVAAGDLFACVRGQRTDGHRFAARALQQGAVALMTDRPVSGIPMGRVGILQVPDVSKTLPVLAARFYNYPSLGLRLVGVTGTSGKTTVTYLLRSILKAAHQTTGILGTIAYHIGDRQVPAANTTPMAWDVQRLLHEMVEAGCRVGVMEVSSHALSQGRVAGCEFDVAVFTNLSREHLDFHKTMKEYAAAKRKLFTHLAASGYKTGIKHAVINWDDPQGPSMARAAAGAAVHTYGLNTAAQVTADAIRLETQFTRFRLQTPQGSCGIRWRLWGRQNISNALAAAAVAQSLGVPLSAVRQGLESMAPVPGRMERIVARPFAVVVDYAHKPQALEGALQTVRELTPGKVTVVFGCGGDRDRGKRAPMGEIAVAGADQVWVTSDNPRNESPQRIISDILQGCRRQAKGKDPSRVHVEKDRLQAIRAALKTAAPGDTVLIAGKGHEDYQLVQGKKHHFDDREVVRRIMSARRDQAA